MQGVRTLPAVRQAMAVVIIATAALVNAWLVLGPLHHITGPSDGIDFTVTFTNAIRLDNPFEEPYWLWSPLAVPLLSLLVPLGLGAWAALHALALIFLPPSVAALVAVSWPFWWDIASGNVGVFVFVAAWAALHGSRVGMVVYLGMCLLMPRPLMVPVLAWLLWKEPQLRLPFVVAAVGQLAVVGAMGLLDDWIVRLSGVVGYELGKSGDLQVNIGLSRWIGYWTLLLLPVAAWLTMRGRLGLASLAASPYLFPFYLLMGFLELRNRRQHQSITSSPRLPGRWRPLAIPKLRRLRSLR